MGRRGPGAGRRDDQLPALATPRARSRPRSSTSTAASTRWARRSRPSARRSRREAPGLPDGRHRLPGHGGHGATAREGRSRGDRARARGRRRRAPRSAWTASWPSSGATRRRYRGPRARRRRRRDGARPGDGRRRRAPPSPRRRARSCTAPLRSRSTCRSTRRARSTSRARARSSRSRREVKAAGGLERFIHVSTAYVAGITEGTFHERQLDAGQEFRNTYEQTKWEAEHVVIDASDLEPGDRPPVDRDGRVGLRLDAGLQRALLADPRVLARSVRRGPGPPRGAGRRRARSTTSPTRWCTCSRTRRPPAS